jgi:hypothetical protein
VEDASVQQRIEQRHPRARERVPVPAFMLNETCDANAEDQRAQRVLVCCSAARYARLVTAARDRLSPLTKPAICMLGAFH